MIDEFRAVFQELIDASVSTDPGRFPAAVQRVLQLAPAIPPGERELALEALGPFIGGGHTAPGITADLSVVASALVEMGADPGPAGVEVMGLLRSVGQGAAVFLHAWDQTGGGHPPEPDDVTADAEERVAQRLGETAPTATVCWWTIRRYGLAAKTMLSQSSVRSAVRSDPGLRAELVAIANQLSGALSEFGDIRALLRMAEATSALVLDRATGRGFRVLFDGIGDNFQLHALLADALIGPEGRGLPGRRPDPRWTAAFRDAPPDPEAHVAQGWWNLVALDGSWVWNEGVPADIPTVDGEHVLVLEEQPFPRSWHTGRRHPMVRGWLEVDEEVLGDEAAAWWRSAAPSASGAGAGASVRAASEDPDRGSGAGGAEAPQVQSAPPAWAPEPAGGSGEWTPVVHRDPAAEPERRDRDEAAAASGEEHPDASAGLDFGGLVRPYVDTVSPGQSPVAPAPPRGPEAFAAGEDPAGGGPRQGHPDFSTGLAGADAHPAGATGQEPGPDRPPHARSIGDETAEPGSAAPDTFAGNGAAPFPAAGPAPGEEDPPAREADEAQGGGVRPAPGSEEASAGLGGQPAPTSVSRPWPGGEQDRPAPEESEPERIPAPGTETAVLPIVPDVGTAEAGTGEGDTSAAGTHPETADDEDTPHRGAPALPPLPPGVSKSSSWGPGWR